MKMTLVFERAMNVDYSGGESQEVVVVKETDAWLYIQNADPISGIGESGHSSGMVPVAFPGNYVP